MSNKINISFLLILLPFFILNIDCQTKIVDFNGRKFQFNETKGNIDSHNASCLGNGMQLALLKSEEEINFITKNKTPKLDALLGLICSDVDDITSPFIWADGRNVTFGAWNQGNECQATGGAVLRDNGVYSRVYYSVDIYGAVCTEVGK